MERTENTPEDARSNWRSPRARAALIMAALAAAAAVISYGDGLFLVRQAGGTGRVDYLYPLLPDGLIVICLISLYDAARAKAARPGWATAGVALGAVLTVAQNLAAGLARTWVLALIDSLVPVVFFVSAEVLNGHIRRGRAAAFPMVHGGGPATPDICPHTVALTAADAARQAYEHQRDCAGEPVTKTELMARFGLNRKQMERALAPVSQDVPAGGLPGPPGRDPGGQAHPGPAAGDTPAGEAPSPAPAPAGAQAPPAGVTLSQRILTAPAGGPRSPSEPMLGTATAGAAVNGDGRG